MNALAKSKYMLLVGFLAVGCSFSKSKEEKPTEQVIASDELSRVDRIFLAINNRNTSALERVLRESSVEDVNTVGADGETPLETCVRNGYVRFSELLLNAGARPLHFASDRTPGTHRSILDVANEQTTSTGQAIARTINQRVEVEKSEFNAQVTRTDFDQAWETCKKFNMFAIDSDLALLNAIGDKVSRLAVINTTEKNLILQIISTINTNHDWNSGRVSSVIKIAVASGDIEYLSRIERVEQPINANLDEALGPNGQIRPAVLDYVTQTLREKNIFCALESIRPTLISRLEQISLQKDYSTWDEFAWIARHITVDREHPVGNAGIRDNFVNYIISYYYSASPSLGAAFPIDDFKMFLDIGKALNGELAVGLREYRLVADASSRYASVREQAAIDVRDVVNFVPLGFWQDVFKLQNFDEILGFTRIFSLSILTADDFVNLVNSISSAQTMANFYQGRKIDSFISQIPLQQIQASKERILFLLKGQLNTTFENGGGNIDNALIQKFVELAQARGLKYSDLELNDIRYREIVSIFGSSHRTPEYFCQINRIAENVPEHLTAQFEGNTFTVSILNIATLFGASSIYDSIHACSTSDSSDHEIVSWANYALSINALYTLFIFEKMESMDPQTYRFLNSQFPFVIHYLRRESFPSSQLDRTVVDRVFQSVDNNRNSLLRFFTILNGQTGVEYSSEQTNTLLDSFIRRIRRAGTLSLNPFDDRQVLNELSLYVLKQTPRLLLSINNILGENYRNFLRSNQQEYDPIYLVQNTFNDLQKRELENQLRPLVGPIDLNLLVTQGHVYLSGNEPFKPWPESSGYLALNYSEADRRSFELVESIDTSLNNSENWTAVRAKLPSFFGVSIDTFGIVNGNYSSPTINGSRR